MQNRRFSSPSVSNLDAPIAPRDGITAMRELVANSRDSPLFSSYSQMIDALKPFLNALAGAQIDEQQATRLAHDLDQWTQLLGKQQVADPERLWGLWPQRADRGQALVPTVYDHYVLKDRSQAPNGSQMPQEDVFAMEGKVMLGRFWTGMNNAVHGGAITLLFDEYLGHVGTKAKLPTARTAYLNTDFRSITPVDKELTIQGQVTRVDGRKQFLSGQLFDGQRLCAEAEGLWVALKPGQV